MTTAKTETAAPPATTAFVARQPILDRQQEVYGYELLFRSGLENTFMHDDPNQATARVMVTGSLLMNLEAIGGGKLCFINVTRDILVRDYATLLPKELMAVEILETVEPDAEVLGACMRLRKAGYLLVLDDYVHSERHADLLAMADIVKVDFLHTSPGERAEIVSRATTPEVRFLAEKVETPEVFKAARDLGYSYFQGYFFSKPTILSAKRVPGFKLNYLHMLQEIQRPGINFQALEGVVKRDVALTYKLLRYINSAYFGLTNKVSSIMHAITMLGAREFKQWASLVVMASMGSDKPNELVIQALVRARFCELLAPTLNMRMQSQELFLMGMFSLVDALLDQPMDVVLKQLPLAPEIQAALSGRPNRLRDVYDYVLAYEKGDWQQVGETAAKLGLDESPVPDLYRDAIQWAMHSFEEFKAAA